MKVTVCPKCRITPDMDNTELVCPKCGRRAVGENLNDTVSNWNNGVLADSGKEPKVVIKDVEIIKEEAKAEAKVEEPFMNEPVEEVPEEKPVKKAPVRKSRTTKKKG